MSKHPVGWAIAAVAAVFVVGLSLSAFTQHASGDQVLPGGHAAKIRSYYALLLQQQGDSVIIPSVEGDHGFILTDVVTAYDEQTDLNPCVVCVSYKVGDNSTRLTISSSARFGSGLPIPKGAEVHVYNRRACDWYGNITLSGYTW